MPLYNPSNFTGSFEYPRNSIAYRYEAVNHSSDIIWTDPGNQPSNVTFQLAENSNRVGLSFWMTGANETFYDMSSGDTTVDENSFAFVYLGDATSVELDLADSIYKRHWIKLIPGSYFEPLVCPTNALCMVVFSQSSTEGAIVKVTEYVES